MVLSPQGIQCNFSILQLNRVSFWTGKHISYRTLAGEFSLINEEFSDLRCLKMNTLSDTEFNVSSTTGTKLSFDMGTFKSHNLAL